MNTQVFLSTNRGGTLGFDRSGTALRLAARFDLTDNLFIQQINGQPIHALEHVFEQLNIGGDIIAAMPWTVEYRRNGNRSLSVGDVVVIGETAYTVSSIGWQRITIDNLLDAISRDQRATVGVS